MSEAGNNKETSCQGTGQSKQTCMIETAAIIHLCIMEHICQIHIAACKQFFILEVVQEDFGHLNFGLQKVFTLTGHLAEHLEGTIYITHGQC